MDVSDLLHDLGGVARHWSQHLCGPLDEAAEDYLASLRLLTPNWLSRLPGWAYRGDDPDGFMSAPEVAAHLVEPGEVVGGLEDDGDRARVGHVPLHLRRRAGLVDRDSVRTSISESGADGVVRFQT